MFVLATIFAAGPAAAPAPAGDAKGVKEQLTEIKEQLKALKDSLPESFKSVGKDIRALDKSIKDSKVDITLAQAAISTLQGQVSDLKTELDALKRRLPADLRLYPSTDKTSFDEIRTRLADMERMLARMQGQSRVAMSAPVGQTGRVLLVNSYPSEMLFVVNGQSQRVLPGGSVALENVPAGAITYEAIAPSYGVVRSTTTSLAAGETLTLTAR
jgi:hypothetical protein